MSLEELMPLITVAAVIFGLYGTAYGRGIRAATKEDVQRVNDKLERTNITVGGNQTDIARLQEQVKTLSGGQADARKVGPSQTVEVKQDG